MPRYGVNILADLRVPVLTVSVNRVGGASGTTWRG